jgi:hypothetical protein
MSEQAAWIGIDPGTTKSGWATISLDGRVTGDIRTNEDVLARLYWLGVGLGSPSVAIERLRGLGKAIGFETIQTIEWVGRFAEARHRGTGQMPVLLTRHEILKALGVTRGSGSADSRVRSRLIAIYGEPGTAKNPGPTYGITGHAWQALAVAHVAKMRG